MAGDLNVFAPSRGDDHGDSAAKCDQRLDLPHRVRVRSAFTASLQTARERLNETVRRVHLDKTMQAQRVGRPAGAYGDRFHLASMTPTWEVVQR